MARQSNIFFPLLALALLLPGRLPGAESLHGLQVVGIKDGKKIVLVDPDDLRPTQTAIGHAASDALGERAYGKNVFKKVPDY